MFVAKRGLGKGMDALFGDDNTLNNSLSEGFELKLSQIEPNRKQPRKNFDAEALEALASSIKTYGVVQPLIVSAAKNGFYTIIAGERRWRAAKLAGLKTLPVIVKHYDEKLSAEVALIENLQREDLNPIEEAEGYNDLMTKYSLTQEEISEKIGKSRSAIANTLRLLSLSDEVKQLLAEKKLTAGHARALVTAKSQDLQNMLAEKIIKEGLSVRQIEALIKDFETVKPLKAHTPVSFAQKQFMLESQKRLKDILKTRVKIVKGEKKGKIEIEFYDMDQLNSIMRAMKL